MKVEIVNSRLDLNLYGLEAIAPDKDYAGTAFKLSGQVWNVIKANNIKNKGKNIWVYGEAHAVFAGVEVEATDINNIEGLDRKQIHLIKYAYCKHVGPYTLIPQIGKRMRDELTSQGQELIMPYIEIYGHWTGDENTCETELIINLK